MKAALTPICAALLALVPLGTLAQEAPLAEDLTQAAAATPENVLELWRADPTRIFSGAEVDVEALQYIARPLVVFADSPFDPNFAQQMELIEDGWNDLVPRDVMVITDTDPAARTPLREIFRPRGFVMILVGKDGRIAQRKPSPWATREMSHAIDKLPLRQQEIRETGTLGGR
ncbi:DUF4174 domain-containing protein [Pseudoroseicyclus tamaricis]|uniref:DUF4174 domain-containing protein n=1 Tax=Pseudoroseicyclus tamaricis TaxID=2705421 RepID=A0A6B2K012_9RHOB|nr:DUF4174 domain-containing protein [Pseudoroseicyclus tamaricis]NDV01002.1 DUF4174 domain-containing protein [Pseudoroseicyclus tamaricis]